MTNFETKTISHKKLLIDKYKSVRLLTDKLCQNLETEDFVVQSIEDVSPTKWHIAHTTWFFEQIVLQNYIDDYTPYDPNYYFLFNSYYNTFGDRVNRVSRGTLSRPTVSEIFNYRKEIDVRVEKFLTNCSDETFEKVYELIVLGLNHEQQHQELLLADIKWNFGDNPLYPAYNNKLKVTSLVSSNSSQWIHFNGGLVEVGHDGNGFSFDNETPRHKVYLQDFNLSDRLVTCGEFLEFINDGGYQKPNLWLDDGWTAVNNNKWVAPHYWNKVNDEWSIFTLRGNRKLNFHEPVCHVSFFEAEAYARWAGVRLPTEFEWEHASSTIDIDQNEHNFLKYNSLHPVSVNNNDKKLKQMFGDVWEWTSSAYLPYPGYKQAMGALGEYNGKFMNGQRVCRGGSCITSHDHFRPTYRNFFQPDKRWTILGFRLAKDN